MNRVADDQCNPSQDPLYLPAHSELDVRIFRLTDQSRKRIWFEWCAEAFLPISPSNIALAPSPPASANGFSINATAPVRSPLQGRGGGAWGGGPIIGSPMSEMSGSATAFGNAPSPLPSSFTDLLGNGSTAGDGSERRIKIGMTRMHNPAGRSSWIGL
jgi:protein arginine N-methyltransferase 5